MRDHLDFRCFNKSGALIRQVLGAVAQFEKTSLVAKLKGARDYKKRETGKCGGRKSHRCRPRILRSR